MIPQVELFLFIFWRICIRDLLTLLTHILKGGLDGLPTHLDFLKCKDPSTYERKSLISVKSHALPNPSTRLIKSIESKLLLSV